MTLSRTRSGGRVTSAGQNCRLLLGAATVAMLVVSGCQMAPTVDCDALTRASAGELRTLVENGDGEAVSDQLFCGADANQVDGNGVSLLVVAALGGYVDVVNALVDAGAEVDARNPIGGGTALHAAAFLGQVGAAEALMDAGADPMRPNDDGGNALTIAELDWGTTVMISSFLQINPGDEATVMAGKAAVAEAIRARLGQ